jgi:hypothetical protein
MADRSAILDEELGVLGEMKSGKVWMLRREGEAADSIFGVVVAADSNYAYKALGDEIKRLGPFESPRAAARALVETGRGN